MSNADFLITTIVNELAGFYNSTTFSVIKFILGIYVIVLILDLVLLFFQRGLGEDLRITLFGSDIPRELMASRSRMKKDWKRIKKELESGDEKKYKVAIIKADAIIEDILRKLKYKGENFSELVANIPEGQVEHVDDIKKAHEVRNRIVHDENFPVDKKLAEEMFSLYEQFLEYFGVAH